MRKIINNKLYDTNTARKLGKIRNKWWMGCTILYRTPRGRYFIYDDWWESIIVMSRAQAIKWCKDNLFLDVLKNHFKVNIKET